MYRDDFGDGIVRSDVCIVTEEKLRKGSKKSELQTPAVVTEELIIPEQVQLPSSGDGHRDGVIPLVVSDNVERRLKGGLHR